MAAGPGTRAEREPESDPESEPERERAPRDEASIEPMRAADGGSGGREDRAAEGFARGRVGVDEGAGVDEGEREGQGKR